MNIDRDVVNLEEKQVVIKVLTLMERKYFDLKGE